MDRNFPLSKKLAVFHGTSLHWIDEKVSQAMILWLQQLLHQTFLTFQITSHNLWVLKGFISAQSTFCLLLTHQQNVLNQWLNKLLTSNTSLQWIPLCCASLPLFIVNLLICSSTSSNTIEFKVRMPLAKSKKILGQLSNHWCNYITQSSKQRCFEDRITEW